MKENDDYPGPAEVKLRKVEKIISGILAGDLDSPISGAPLKSCHDVKNCRPTDCQVFSRASVPCWYLDEQSIKSRVFEPRFPPRLAQCRECRIYKEAVSDDYSRLVDDLGLICHVLKSSWKWIRESRSLRINLIRNSFDGIIATDVRDLVTVFNMEAGVILGWNEEEAIGRMRWQDLLPAGLSEALQSPLKREGSPARRGFFRKELQVRAKTGEAIPARVSGMILMDEGIELGKVFFLQDMREIDKLRAGLIESERLAATGQAVAAISHSIKNILDGLKGGIYIFKRGKRLKDENTAEDGWKMVERNVDIIFELVNDLLNYSKNREPLLEPCDVEAVVRQAVDTMRRKADEKGVRIIVECSPSLKSAMMDPFAMNHCLANLISNAIDAIPKNREGVVRISTHGQNNDLVISVKDNGAGMSRELMKKVIVGMFSTKGSKGTGLGLLSARKVAVEHKGELEIDSKENEGTVVTVRIPK